MVTAGASDDNGDKARRLLQFLQGFVQLRSRPVTDFSSYEKVIFFHDMPQGRGCSSPAWEGEADNDLWLEVKKQVMPTCPQLPDELRLWVDDVSLQPSSGLEPTLKPVIHVAAPESPEDQADAESEVQLVAHKLEDHPEIQTAWEAYLEVWLPWSQEYLHRSAVQGLYHQLFDAYDKLKQQRETLELVVGFGLYSTQVPRVRRHVFTAKAELHFNSDRGIMSLRCPQPPEGADLSIEDDFLANRPMQADYASVRNRLAEIGDAVWGRDLIIAALTRWSNLLGPDTHFSDALTPASEATAQPSLHFAPALILRRRGLQGLVRTYQSIIDQVSDGGGALPLGLERLVDHVDDTAASGFGPGQDPGGFRAAEHQDVYFPLPTNDEQRRIIENLGRRRGILVQGPPGTGKSHTIANLICHLLATGQRVLVTSETPRALSVLKEKLPDAVKPLCVSLLGASREAFDELSASVNGITTRHSNPQDYPVIIRRLEADLNETREKRANNYKRLLELREAETHPVTVAGGKYRGTAAVIARTINREEANLGWIGRVRDPHEEPPLTALEAQELLHAHRALSRERRGELELAVVPVDSLLTAEQFAGLIRAERTAQRYSESFADVQRDPLYPSLERVAPERLADLTSALEGFQGARDAIRNRPEPWLPRAEADILGGRAGAWQSVFTQTKEGLASFTIDDIRLADRVTLALPQEVPRHRVLDDAKAISDHLNAGGKWRRFGFLTAPAKERDYLRKSVRVDDRPADTSEALRKLILVLSVEITLARLSSIWQAHAEAIWGPYETQAIELAENLHSLEQIMELAVKAREIRRLLEENEPRLPIPDFAGERPAELYRLIRAVEAERSFKQSREAYRDVQGALRTTLSRPNTHPLNQALLDALEARDVQAGASARSELEGLEADRRRAVIAQGLQGRLASVAPEAARRLEETAHNEAWPERLEALQDAWHWGRAKHWLREREEPGLQQRLEREQRDLHEREANTTAALASEKAWQNLMSRLTQEQSSNLQAWRLSVRSIPRNTRSPNRARFQAAAREHMEACIPAIPAWILPRYRLAETLPIGPEIFDVVIVDEASQTGIDGLFLLYLAKRIIVVGDDQQISPSDIGIDTASVDALQARFLEGIPFRAQLTPTHSLYDHAVIRFGGRIVLREHFRCMPEIIRFSNLLCYEPNGTSLIPLRTYPPNRLEPVMTTYVQGGYQGGSAASARNLPEAEAVVARVAACVRDPRYQGKSLGVISLLGSRQAEEIQRRLIEAIGPEEMEARRLICGDAYAFQGDERDVMFLSMVSAPAEGRRIGALTTNSASQRFNVAASRARDQLWLFHSAKLEHLSANPDCVRRKLLEYCLNPERQVLSVSGIDVEKLRADAADPYRGQISVPAPFDSWFEVDVFLAIHGRGYRVVPQVEFAGYRIDLVVEGSQGRLAVECDGDYWHGPEAYERDVARQRQLERSGWEFVRIRGSSFYLDAAAAMEPLWVELNRRGIHPTGARSDVTPTPTTVFDDARREIGPIHLPDQSAANESPEALTVQASSELPDDLYEDEEREEPQLFQPLSPRGILGSGRREPSVGPLPQLEADLVLGEDEMVSAVDEQDIRFVMQVPPETWFELARWVGRNGRIRDTIAAEVGELLRRGGTVNSSQARRAVQLYRQAFALGYPDEDSPSPSERRPFSPRRHPSPPTPTSEVPLTLRTWSTFNRWSRTQAEYTEGDRAFLDEIEQALRLNTPLTEPQTSLATRLYRRALRRGLRNY